MHLTFERRQRTQAFCGFTSMGGSDDKEDDEAEGPMYLGGDAADAGDAD